MTRRFTSWSHPGSSRVKKFSAAFRNGGTVKQLATDLENGTVGPASKPSIHVIQCDGNVYTLDNRRFDCPPAGWGRRSYRRPHQVRGTAMPFVASFRCSRHGCRSCSPSSTPGSPARSTPVGSWSTPASTRTTRKQCPRSPAIGSTPPEPHRAIDAAQQRTAHPAARDND